ncbi:hypothetical protein [Serratia fonticola]|uniref:Uncharacterized protein n=1 Tax=Serratia fonticola TaxID=47917 RepID=A0AAE7JSJ4_SERFO|nr:hypothetical protein [Serratia fonticola]QKJ57618.1 hypothetical protein G9399_03435 [Serratia fonticola]
MQLNLFPISSPVQNQADWVELKCLSDHFDHVVIDDIRSAMELQNDTQDDDIAREDRTLESVIDTVLQEITERQKSLQNSYPFQIEEGGRVVSLLTPFKDITIDQKVYIYCLIFSHVSRSSLITLDRDVLPADRDLMQICSTIAAAGLVRGPSISFGFPRVDRTRFYDKTKQVLVLLGEGELHELADVNPVHSLSPKDAGIDIISWKPTADNRPGKLIYISQVASGNNWKEKPVKTYIDILTTYWLKHPILSRMLDAIFIPFDMLDDPDNGITADQFLSSQMLKLGTIFYRRRIPALFKEGIDFIQQNQHIFVERVNECDKIHNYVDERIRALKAVAA